MSKERARRRAEERARKSAPKSKAAAVDASVKPPTKKKKQRARSAREERRRKRVLLVGGLWLLANVLIWILSDSWNARWLGLTLTTIAVPLIVWLVWDPQRRVDL
jgi:Flp pilus assembly protein TadB